MRIIFSPKDRKIGGSLLLFVLLQILTYVLFANDWLAARVVQELAIDGGMPKGFVLLGPVLRGELSLSLARALEEELFRRGYPVLKRKEEIPPENRIYGDTRAGERVIAGYRNGCDLSLQTRTLLPGVIFASYGFYTGPAGAWGVSRVFVWCLGTWIPVWASPPVRA